MKKDKNQVNSIVNKNRSNLGEELPLEYPYVLFIDPCNACNFHCKFCAPQTQRESTDFFRGMMSYDLYKKIIDDLTHMQKKLRMLRLYTMGEPLLNPNFAEMVKYAKQKNVADFIETVTNGSLLSKELNQELVDSGIDRIRISVEALDAIAYKELVNYNIDFDQFVENIADLYQKSRGKCEIYVKTVDASADTEDKIKKFYELFEGKADKVFIESIAPVWPNFDKLKDEFAFQNTGLMGTKVDKTIECCPFVFYGCVINPDGEVTPCCADWQRGTVYGNISKNSFEEIWYGKKMIAFWRNMLSGKKNIYPSCQNCEYINYVSNDNIDKDAEKILSKIKN